MSAPVSTFAALLESANARQRSVFINCPFDRGFSDARAAIVFGVVCSGLLPRTADDLGLVGVPRMTRILRAMSDSLYSIHDLSRCQGEGAFNLARFNMPLELGVAIANGYATTSSENDHQWLALAPEVHPYNQFASDLAGYDLKRHDGKPTIVCTRVMSWLQTLEHAVVAPPLPEVLTALPKFLAAYRQLNLEWRDEPDWIKVWHAAANAVPV
ncbi:MAG: hypothetical protein QOF13_2461 [Solirubrobacterales bacterium]|nr:hypothetical protein [Solirubrobacterales bacterium]